MKLYRFQTVRLSIIRNLFTVHSAMVYVIQVCRQLSSRSRLEPVSSWSCLKAVYKPVWHTACHTVQKFPAWPRWQKQNNFAIFQYSLPLFQHIFHICELITIDDAIYPLQHFPCGVAFVCRARNFWTLPRMPLLSVQWKNLVMDRGTVRNM